MTTTDTPAYVNIFEEAKNMYKPGGSYETSGVANVKAGVKKAKAGGKASAISSGLGGTTVMGGIDVASARSEARDIQTVKSDASSKLGSISMQMAGIGESARQADLGREFAGDENAMNRETQRYIADQNNASTTRGLDQREWELNQGLKERTDAQTAANWANTRDTWGNSGSANSSGSTGNYGAAPDLFAAQPAGGGGGGSSTPVPGSSSSSQGGAMSFEAWKNSPEARGKNFLTDDSISRGYQQYATAANREAEAQKNATAAAGGLKKSFGSWLDGAADTDSSRASYMQYWGNS